MVPCEHRLWAPHEYTRAYHLKRLETSILLLTLHRIELV